MSRFVSSSNQAAAALPNVCLAIAADLDFTSGHIRVHDAVGPLTINSNVFDGIGKFGSINVVEEGMEVIARPVTLTLSGADASLISTATTEVYQGRSVILYLALYNPSTMALVDAPEILWSGKMDAMQIQLAADQSQISLRCEHRLRREPVIARYTDADQQLAYSGDRFFDLIGKIHGFRGTWGSRGVVNDGSGNTSLGGGGGGNLGLVGRTIWRNGL